jgi:hypothetical protein
VESDLFLGVALSLLRSALYLFGVVAGYSSQNIFDLALDLIGDAWPTTRGSVCEQGHPKHKMETHYNGHTFDISFCLGGLVLCITLLALLRARLEWCNRKRGNDSVKDIDG